MKLNKKRSEIQKRQELQESRKNILTPQSDFFVREAYKTLRTNVSFALTGESKSKVVVITSALQGEGKSITAVNLAASYAMTDCRVLIIDCDLRRPKLARLLRMGSKIGLSNLLLDPELLEKAIMKSSVDGVDVILSGSIPPNPSELLGSTRMVTLIEELRQRYDYIILDSPPVTLVTDAVVLAPVSDGVLVLVRANRAERGAVVHAVAQLEYSKAKILGFILNGIGPDKSYYGYGKKRYRRYFYYSGYKRYGYSTSTPVAYVPDKSEEDDG